ncbi:unnamed protein product [Jaminaea pallidilutea]
MNDLIQIALPDDSTFISCTISEVGRTAKDVINALLTDSANVLDLERVFQGHFKQPCWITSGDGDKDEDRCRDSNGAIWALQEVIYSPANREWSDSELSQTGIDLVALNRGVVAESQVTSDSASGSSSLHKPKFRLVCADEDLTVRLRFLRVPGIPQGWCSRLWFLGASSSAELLTTLVCREYGLQRTLVEGVRSSQIEYALAIPRKNERELDTVSHPTGLPPNTSLPSLLSAIQSSDHETPTTLLFTVSSHWQSQLGTVAANFSKHLRPALSVTTTALGTPDRPETYDSGSILATAELSAELSAEEDSDTLRKAQRKQENLEPRPNSTDLLHAALTRPSAASPPPRRRDNARGGASTRLSRIFEGWTGFMSSPVESETRPQLRSSALVRDRSVKVASVSEPFAVESSHDLAVGLDLQQRLQSMTEDLEMSQASRAAIFAMPSDRQLHLVTQHESNKQPSRPSGPSQSSEQASLMGSIGHMSSAILKRFSSTSPIAWETDDEDAEENSSDGWSSPHRSDTSEQLQPADTGTSTMSAQSLWSVLWGDSGTAAPAQEGEKTPQAYAHMLQARRLSRREVVKTLIALRVSLSCASLAVLTVFLLGDGQGADGSKVKSNGLDTLETLLSQETATLIRSANNRKELSDSVIAESLKCLRGIINTSIGLGAVLQRPNLVVHLAYGLRTPALKVRSAILDLLATLCAVGATDGHRLVCAALSELKVAVQGTYRFDWLVEGLRLDDIDATLRTEDEDDGTIAESALWDYRANVMILINALASSPEEVEERVAIRDEFARRGLDTALQDLLSCDPPDSVQAQLQIWMEEKSEDMEDTIARRSSSFQIGTVGQTLADLQADHPQHFAVVEAAVTDICSLLQRDIDDQFATELLYVVSKFLEHSFDLVDFEQGWQTFMQSWLGSLQHLIGHQAVIKADGEAGFSNVPSALLRELQTLRDHNSTLITDAEALKAQIQHEAATEAVLDVASPSIDSAGGGLIQRLIEKEKEIAALRSEVDDLKKLSPAQNNHRSPEPSRASQAMLQDLAQLNQKVADLQGIVEDRDKEIGYLTRSLQTVYSRLQSAMSGESKIDAKGTSSGTDDGIESEERTGLVESEERTGLVTGASEDAEAVHAPVVGENLTVDSVTSISSTAQDNVPAAESASCPVSPPPPPPPPPPPLPALPSRLHHKNAMIGLATSTASASSSLSQDRDAVGASSTSLGRPHKASDTPVSDVAAQAATGSATTQLPLPPPPPPPPAFGQHQLKSVAPIKTLNVPQRKRRALFWSKVAHQDLSETVWNGQDRGVEVSIPELDQLFALDNAPVAKKQTANKVPAQSRPLKTVLELRRAQNVAILLSRVPLNPLQIRAALVEVRRSKLTLDHLKALKQCMPSSEEAKLVREYEGDIKTLSKADQLFYQLSGIPRLEQRITCMLFMRKFEIALSEIDPDLRTLRAAAQEVCSNSKLKVILRTVLEIGNVLNASTFRGAAAGFQLGDLAKLRETKPLAPSPEAPTLLHFLARTLNNADKGLVGFLDDCSHVEPAGRLSTQAVTANVSTLFAGYANVKEEIQCLSVRKDVEAHGDFLDCAQEFVQAVQARLSKLREDSDTTAVELSRAVSYFGGNASHVSPEEVFAQVASFGQALMRAEVDCLQADSKKQEDERRKQRMRARGLAPPTPAVKLQIPEPPAPEVRGPLGTQMESQQAWSGPEATDDVTPTPSRVQTSQEVQLPSGSKFLMAAWPLCDQDAAPVAGMPDHRQSAIHHRAPQALDSEAVVGAVNSNSECRSPTSGLPIAHDSDQSGSADSMLPTTSLLLSREQAAKKAGRQSLRLKETNATSVRDRSNSQHRPLSRIFFSGEPPARRNA